MTERSRCTIVIELLFASIAAKNRFVTTQSLVITMTEVPIEIGTLNSRSLSLPTRVDRDLPFRLTV